MPTPGPTRTDGGLSPTNIPDILQKYESELLVEWVREQTAPGVIRDGLIKADELEGHCREFLRLLVDATRGGNVVDVGARAFASVRELLDRISRTRGEQGFSPSETAVFVLSLKRPLFARLQRELSMDSTSLFRELWLATELLDKLGLYTTEVHQQAREGFIARQQSDMLELSTPVVKLWDGVLALPLIGTLDSHRTQVVMETLLQRIVDTGSEVAIIDITGVPTVDTLVAQHLMKTVAAARLMGVECIISGIRPQIAQTIVHLGVALGEVPTKATLAAAFRLALTKLGARAHERASDDGPTGRRPAPME
ncbi:STAS domain-containing protein [Myxococcota bacterium]|nr:STAS domain-containing protein [Myxococcota bacterium]